MKKSTINKWNIPKNSVTLDKLLTLDNKNPPFYFVLFSLFRNFVENWSDMDYQEILSKRRSCRVFTDEDVSGDDVRLLLRAALMSPTSRNMRSWQFVVVDDKQTLEKLSDAKEIAG